MAKAKRILSLRCPICKTIVLKNDPEFPFCSGRCRTIDLGKWASGAYRVSTPLSEYESDEVPDVDPLQRGGSGSNNDDSR